MNRDLYDLTDLQWERFKKRHEDEPRRPSEEDWERAEREATRDYGEDEDDE